MKVVFITTVYLPHIGGIECYIHDISNRLIDDGHEVNIIVADKNCEEIVVDNIDGAKVIRLPSYEICGFYILRKKKYIDIINDELHNAKVVHLNACKFLYKHLAMMRQKYNYRLIVTSHGWLFHTSKNLFIKNLYFKYCVVKYYMYYDKIINVSIQDQQIAEKFGIKNSIVINNGADIKKFSMPDYKNTFDNNFIYWGRISVNKGIYECLVKLAQYECDFTFNIIGVCEDDSYTNRLNKFIEENGICDKVKFLGKLSNEQIKHYIELSDVILLPSLHEGFGFTLVEALVTKRLILANNIDSYKYILDRTGTSDFLYDFSDDRNSMLDKINKLRHKKVEPKNIDQFSVETMVNNTISVYFKN